MLLFKFPLLLNIYIIIKWVRNDKKTEWNIGRESESGIFVIYEPFTCNTQQTSRKISLFPYCI